MHKLKILDECAKKLDKCDRPTTICQNTAGSYKCICNKGMNYVPENNTCPKEAKCEPVEEAVEGKWVTCICPTGFKFNPKTRICDDIG